MTRQWPGNDQAMIRQWSGNVPAICRRWAGNEQAMFRQCVDWKKPVLCGSSARTTDREANQNKKIYAGMCVYIYIEIYTSINGCWQRFCFNGFAVYYMSTLCYTILRSLFFKKIRWLSFRLQQVKRETHIDQLMQTTLFLDWWRKK